MDRTGCKVCQKVACGGCNSDPYVENIAWFDPTSYNVLEHGPSYLPGMKLSSEQKTGVQALVQKHAAYYDVGSQAVSVSTALPLILASLRSAAFIHQTHHWQTKGAGFYADHQLFDRIYNESLEAIDQLAERIVGLGGAVAAVHQADLIRHVVVFAHTLPIDAITPSEVMVAVSLNTEVGILIVLERVLKKYGHELSPGTTNLLQGIADKHESFGYLLQQRSSEIKEAVSKYARGQGQ